jgi:hypothetical protein
VKGMLEKRKTFKVENHSLFEKYPLQMKWTNTCISYHDAMGERQQCLAPCLPMRNELPVERNTAYN